MVDQPFPNRQDLEREANWRIDREIARKTMRSNFHADGSLREEAQAQSVLAEYLHLAGIPWAATPDGADHCEWLSRLTEYVACLPESWGGIVGGPMARLDAQVLHAVATLYCTGRNQPSSGPLDSAAERTYAARSAENAERFLRDGGGDKTVWSKAEVREDVCRLVYQFGLRFLEPGVVLQDKRLQVLSDAVAFESVRYAPNTAHGLTLLRERYVPERMHTGWARSKDNLRAWMKTRGWN